MSHKQNGKGEYDRAPDGDAAQHHAGRRGARADQTERETRAWRRETGYRPSVNQPHDDPVPADDQAPPGREADGRDKQEADGSR